MADVRAYLEGGPCDGKLHTITPAEGDTGEIVCKQHVYKVVSPAQFHNGHPVFKDAGKVTPPKPPPTAKTAHLHKGWSDLQHSMNHNLPASLKASHRSLSAGLRSISRAHKVRLK